MNRKKIPFLALPRFEREVRQRSILQTGLIRFRKMEGLLGMNNEEKTTTYHTIATNTTLLYMYLGVTNKQCTVVVCC